MTLEPEGEASTPQGCEKDADVPMPPEQPGVASRPAKTVVVHCPAPLEGVGVGVGLWQRTAAAKKSAERYMRDVDAHSSCKEER